MRAVLVFCEGNHDVAFTTRSLGALSDAHWVSKPVGKIPAPLGTKHDPKNPSTVVVRSIIATRYERRNMDHLGLQDVAHAPVPTFEAVVEVPEDDTLYVLIRCGSDHAQWGAGRYGPVGLFVFHDPSTGTGTLEDVLDPLVQQQWPKKWDAADAYLRDHVEPDDRIHDGPAAYKKARIGVTGQFTFPGGPMTEVVRNRRRGLSTERFTGPVSRQLVEFLRRVPW